MSASTGYESLIRVLQLLQLIPRSPAQVTVKDLTEELNHLGFKISSRTVQRDLNDVAAVLPLEKNDKSKPYGWKWARDAKTHFSLMNLQDALTLHLVNQHLTQLLPPNMLSSLEPMFKQAEQTIQNLGEKNQVSYWLESALAESPTQKFLAPNVKDEIQTEIYKALFESRPLEAKYRSQNSSETKDYILHPVGIMQRGNITYLGAMVYDYDDIRLFALHRFEEAQMNHLETARTSPITWKEFLSKGGAGFGGESVETIIFKARISNNLASILEETPLSDDQKLEDIGGGGFRVTATVEDSWQFRWWILSQGRKIRVLAPDNLEADIKTELEKAYKGYI